ncbi:hypothetical protein Pmani_005402 [Petrolisthes manimaculis]|uniref:Fucosyltransferase N-terminal domain-containing protein n=1 Tax=Petrolisthes manimaculis TaxID=1843537 RepID=A0AAE1UGP8_9EUCA|nr:hypothetical protein Pmani_005402 [Petrolisthes manimaculis]
MVVMVTQQQQQQHSPLLLHHYTFPLNVYKGGRHRAVAGGGVRRLSLELGDSILPWEEEVVKKDEEEMEEMEEKEEEMEEEEEGRERSLYHPPRSGRQTTHPHLKKILLWNDFFGSRDFLFGLGRRPFVSLGCRINTCYTTTNHTRFLPHQLDAVVWHARCENTTYPPINTTNTTRWPHTRYIFLNEESPVEYVLQENLTNYKHLFNWTITLI